MNLSFAEGRAYSQNANTWRNYSWAQCHDRNAISWTEKFKLDVWYVDHVSLMTDLKVIWITIMKVMKRADISADGQATMEAFNGRN